MKRLVFLTVAACLLVSGQANAQKLTDYVRQHKREQAEQLRIEKERYDVACKTNTKSAYDAFLELYPAGRYTGEVRQRLADCYLWEKAKAANTIEAYRLYKSETRYGFFAHEADAEIGKLEAAAAWNGIRQTGSMDTIRVYLRKYPGSPHSSDADRRLHELRGVACYLKNDYASAYREFSEAGGRDSLDEAHKPAFDVCEEHADYHKLTEHTAEPELAAFLEKFPASRYHDDVSNRLAIRMAESLTLFSTESAYNDALSHATDEPTKRVVCGYIEQSKRAYRQYVRWQRRRRVMDNGGYVLLGTGIMDFGWNLVSKDNRTADVGYYNIPIGVKVGNYASPVQFEAGIMPGVLFWRNKDDGTSSDHEETSFRFHLPVFARLKISLTYKSAAKAKWYVEGNGWYNAVREKALEADFSVGGGIGVAWRHWDWHLYYKQGLDNTAALDEKFIATSFVYYF